LSEPVARFLWIQSVGQAAPPARGYAPGHFYESMVTTRSGTMGMTILAPVIVYRDSRFAVGAQNMTLCLGDIIRTGPDCICAIEFLVGGRVGINRSSAVQIVTLRSVKAVGSSVVQGANRASESFARTLATGWVKTDGRGLNQPIEIQTNGGVLGIKGSRGVTRRDPS